MIGRTVYHLTTLEKMGVAGATSALACTQIDEELVFAVHRNAAVD